MLVIKRLNDMTYQVRMNERDVKIIHFDQLKPYEGSNIPKWVHII